MNDLATPMDSPVAALDKATLRIERLLPGPVERLWTYLTDSKKRGMWFASGEMELRAGGKSTLVFNHDDLSHETYPEDALKHKGKSVVGHVIACEPPRLITFTFGNEPDSSEVTFELEPRGKDVLLTITHRKVPTRDYLVSYASGWETHVGILADLLAGSKPRGFWTTHGKLSKRYGESFPQ